MSQSDSPDNKRKPISLRRERVKALKVQSGVVTGYLVAVGATGGESGCSVLISASKGGPGTYCPGSLISCAACASNSN
jgi:hypothetical protein